MMVSISPRWPSEKLWADAAGGMPQSASTNSAGASKRNEGMTNPLGESRSWRTFIRRLDFLVAVFARLVAFLARHGLCSDDIIGLDPSGRADGEAGFRARSEFARGLVVAAKEGGLCRCQIGLRVIPLSAIGHCELGITERRLGLACHRRPQNRDRFVGIGLIIRRHEGLPK